MCVSARAVFGEQENWRWKLFEYFMENIKYRLAQGNACREWWGASCRSFGLSSCLSLSLCLYISKVKAKLLAVLHQQTCTNKCQKPESYQKLLIIFNIDRGRWRLRLCAFSIWLAIIFDLYRIRTVLIYGLSWLDAIHPYLYFLLASSTGSV